MTPKTDMAGHTLLAVFAHPDDESLATGGLLACCAARGARVCLLCLTKGEIGPGQPAPDLPDLASTRARELDAAAAVLGLTIVRLLDHPDGMLTWLEPGTLAGHIRAVIDEIRPDAVVTFGDDGLYWHPDHLATHDATREAVAALGPSGPALYFVTMPKGQMRAVVDTAARRRAEQPDDGHEPARTDVLGVGNPDAFGDSAHPPTMIVRTGGFAVLKLAALRCHRTQVGTGPFDHLTDEDAVAILAEEHYRRAEIGGQSPSFIDRLAAASAESP